jgi:hypothetical protein
MIAWLRLLFGTYLLDADDDELPHDPFLSE